MELVPRPGPAQLPAPGLGRRARAAVMRQVLADDRVHRRPTLQRPHPRPAEDVIVDRDGEVRHGAPRVARAPYHTGVGHTPSGPSARSRNASTSARSSISLPTGLAAP